MKINDTDRLKTILNFLMIRERIKTSGEIEDIENEIYKKMELLLVPNPEKKHIKEIHSYLETSILLYKEIIQKKYFEYGVIANEYLNTEINEEFEKNLLKINI